VKSFIGWRAQEMRAKTRLILFVLNPTNFFGLASIQTRIERKTNYYTNRSNSKRENWYYHKSFPSAVKYGFPCIHRPISEMCRMWLSTNFDFNLKTKPFSMSRYSIDVFCTHSPWYRWYCIIRYSVGTIHFDVNKLNINIKRRTFQPKKPSYA